MWRPTGSRLKPGVLCYRTGCRIQKAYDHKLNIWRHSVWYLITVKYHGCQNYVSKLDDSTSVWLLWCLRRHDLTADINEHYSYSCRDAECWPWSWGRQTGRLHRTNTQVVYTRQKDRAHIQNKKTHMVCTYKRQIDTQGSTQRLSAKLLVTFKQTKYKKALHRTLIMKRLASGLWAPPFPLINSLGRKATQRRINKSDKWMILGKCLDTVNEHIFISFATHGGFSLIHFVVIKVIPWKQLSASSLRVFINLCYIMHCSVVLTCSGYISDFN